MTPKELPVFFDQSGKRWKRIKLVLAVFLVLIVVGVIALVPPVLRPVAVSRETAHASSGAPSLQQIEAAFARRNVPVLGQGQFIRAVRIDRRGQPVVRDVFSGRYIRGLTEREALLAGSNQYAFERYGKLPDRQIVLTFDDGPDARYTPAVLDVLSKHHVPAAFFVVGANVVKHPEIAERIVREGHTLGNHTFGHIDFDFKSAVQAQQEINQTGRVIRAATGYQSAFMRVPYAGNTDESQRDSIRGILHAQQLGYVETAFDYDTNDWKFKSAHKPDPRALASGSGQIVLLHDAGGNRNYTVKYLDEFITMAKKAGYTFVGLDQAYPGPPLQARIAPTLADKTSFAANQAMLVWPVKLMYGLFAVSVLLTLGVTGTNIALAAAARRRPPHMPSAPKTYQPKVTVLVPAYNEAKVLAKSVRSLLASEYKRLVVTIIDDGSKDETFEVARLLSAEFARVKVLRQANLGKAAALNNGLRHSSGEVVISIDADTIFSPDTVGCLVRHFYDPRVGAVAGTVRVGNIRNILTRWQALEYITSIAIDRAAQAFLGAILVVPGACGAWRRRALTEAGGFSDRTLAEDCDGALAIHECGYTIVQDTEAISRTECPLSVGDLAKQRFRWIFGNIQAYWKHRRMFFNRRFGWLGLFVLPGAAVTLLLPMIFWPLLIGVTVSNILNGRWWVVVLFSLIIMVLQAVVALVGLRFAGESLRHMLAVPITRLVYGPLRTYILYRSLLTVLRGALVTWNKFKRTDTIAAVPQDRARPGKTSFDAG